MDRQPIRRSWLFSFPTRTITLSFAAVILVGTLLLMLPVSSRTGAFTPFLDCLFTATSSTCVTGLVVHDTYAYWSAFGQCVILALIQIGGLGVVTVASAIALLAGGGILLVGLCVLFLWADFGGSSVSITSERVAVSAFLYDTEVAPQDIRSVTLLEALPEDDYVRTNGLDDGRRLIGHFRGRETGPCEMYLYTAASPLLAVETGEGTLYFNSQDPAQTQTWYADLLAVTAGM